MKFGKTLYELRKQAGLSQKELANLLDVAQASINYWEKGQRTPSLEAAINISTFFNISLDQLTDDMASDIIESAESQPLTPEIEELELFANYLKTIGCNIIINSKNILGNKETVYTLFYDGKSILLDYNNLIKLSNEAQDYIKFKIEQLIKNQN